MLIHLLVALSLAMDAMVVSVSNGICFPKMPMRHALRAAFAFGFFQCAMPILGWWGGAAFSGTIRQWDHWIAFALLTLVGGKMIKESLGAAEEETCACQMAVCAKVRSVLHLRSLLILGVATSIDALAVGLSYRLINQPILLPALLIGIVTFFLSLLGLEFGRKLGRRFGKWAECMGGLVLVFIGLKILIDHLKMGI